MKTETKPYAMTESDRGLVAMALRNKADGDDQFAFNSPDPRLADQFRRQAKQARELANRIDGADLVDVWPYSE